MSEHAYRSDEHPLGAVRRTHGVDRSGLWRITAIFIGLAFVNGALFALLSRREEGRLIRGIAFAAAQIACALIAHVVRLGSTVRVIVRERGIELGEGRRAIPFAAIRHIEQRNRALVLLHLVSGEPVKVLWVDDRGALLSAIRQGNTRLTE